jgi:hypothetical protein
MRYDATELTQSAVLNDTPNGASGGIWMDGTGAALDADGNMFVATGNGTFDDTNNVLPPLAPNNDFGETFLNLNPTTLAVQDFYAPSQTATWSEEDLDLASAGVTVLPDGAGPATHPNVLIGSDKSGHLYMIDRNNMSHFFANADNIVQYLALPGASVCFNADQQCVYSAPGYWNGTVYEGLEDGPLMAFELSSGLIPATAQQVAIPTSQSAESYAFPDPTPAISASPTGGAIVWVLDNHANGTNNGSSAMGPAILRAYDATNLGTTLYSSSARPADTGGTASKFVQPVVANGHVYIVGTGVLTVYGLAP